VDKNGKDLPLSTIEGFTPGTYYPIITEKVDHASFDGRGWLLFQTIDDHGNKRWFHYKVQASIVTHEGFCLPIASEWIENEPNYDKQDCERKAFYRLVKKLRVLYPRLEMCLLLDNLFACQPAFNAMEKARMQYIAVFKEGFMSYIYPWVMDVKGHVAKDNIIVETEEKEIAQRNRRCHEEKMLRGKPQNKKRKVTTETTYSWATGIEFSEERSLFNVVTCKEIYEGSRPLVDYLPLDKPTTIALKEIAAGKVILGNGTSIGAIKESTKNENV